MLPPGRGQGLPGYDIGFDDVLRLPGRVGRGRFCAGHEKDRRRPGRNEVETRHQLHEEGRQKCPVPSDEPDHRDGHQEIEHVVKRGRHARCEEREHDNLNDVRGDREEARRSNASRCNCQAQLGYLGDLPSPAGETRTTGSLAIGAGAMLTGGGALVDMLHDESVAGVPGIQSPRFTTRVAGCWWETMTARRAWAAGFCTKTQVEVVRSRPP